MARQIAVDPNVHFGQPCLAGTRVPVYCVLELVEAGVPFDEIVAKYYPTLSVEDVRACVGSTRWITAISTNGIYTDLG